MLDWSVPRTISVAWCILSNKVSIDLVWPAKYSVQAIEKVLEDAHILIPTNLSKPNHFLLCTLACSIVVNTMFNILLYQQKFHGFIELSVCNLCACITLRSHGAFKALWFVAPYTNLETIFSECSNIEAKIPKRQYSEGKILKKPKYREYSNCEKCSQLTADFWAHAHIMQFLHIQMPMSLWVYKIQITHIWNVFCFSAAQNHLHLKKFPVFFVYQITWTIWKVGEAIE